MKKKIAKFLLAILFIFLVVVLAALALNVYVRVSTRDRIITADEAAKKDDIDCILVLGCGVYADGSLSPMLKDRMDLSLDVYEKGASEKLLMSGDHGTPYYNEVRAMKNYALQNGVTDSADIFMDHAGFSTYDSLYRAKEIFGVDKVIIVSNSYHLYRALYIADKLGIEAYGVGADDIYTGKEYREFREIFARDKDFIKCIIKPDPKFLGDKIDIHGDGNVTED